MKQRRFIPGQGPYIWRHRRAYPDTPYNRSIHREKFPGGRNYNKFTIMGRRPRKMSRQEKEMMNSMVEGLMFMFLLLVVGSVILTWVSVLVVVLVLEFVIKTFIFALIRIRKKKTKVFKTNSFEKKICELLTSSFDCLSKLGIPKHRKKSYDTESERTCEICGGNLRTRRKYCSECRPSGRATPYEYD